MVSAACVHISTFFPLGVGAYSTSHLCFHVLLYLALIRIRSDRITSVYITLHYAVLFCSAPLCSDSLDIKLQTSEYGIYSTVAILYSSLITSSAVLPSVIYICIYISGGKNLFRRNQLPNEERRYVCAYILYIKQKASWDLYLIYKIKGTAFKTDQMIDWLTGPNI